MTVERRITGSISTVISIVGIVLLEIFFARQVDEDLVQLDITQINLLSTLLILMFCKIPFMAPFFAQMFFDLLFDHLYVDVDYELHPVLTVAPSPTNRPPPIRALKSKSALQPMKKPRHKSLELVHTFD